MGFGTEILFVLMLALILFGPKRLHTMLGHLARAKARFEQASHGLQSQLEVELDTPSPAGKSASSQALAGDQ